MKEARALPVRDPMRDGARRAAGVVPRAQGAARPPQGAVALRRRSQLPRRRGTGWARRAFALALVAGASAAAVLAGGEVLSRADALPMHTLAVRGADGSVAEEVRAYAGIEPGTPLFRVALDDVAARILEHPYVRSAEVRRVPPDTIEVTVELREARALLDAGALYLVDAEGAAFKSARPGDGLDLPLVTGVAPESVEAGEAGGVLRDALALLDAHARAGAPGGEVSEIHVEEDGALALVLSSGPRVHVGGVHAGAARVEDKLARLAVITDRLERAGQRALSIRLDDERRPERSAVRLRVGTETGSRGGS